VPDTLDNFPVVNGSKALQLANLYRLTGDAARARPLFTQVLPKVRAQLEQQRGINLAYIWLNIASVELGLGHAAEGLDAIAKAQAVLDQAKDQVYGPNLTEISASLYAQAQRPDLAVPLLAKALTTPGIGIAYSPVMLWIDPAWDPIRASRRCCSNTPMPSQPTPAAEPRMNELWQRLKQRKLVQWALAYVAAAFALLQGIDIVAQRFGWPDAIERWLIIAIAVGFFVALVLAWYHGERGAQRVSGVELLILALLLAIGGGALWRFGKVPQAATFIAPVAASGSGTAVAETVIPEKSIAVLPLVNGSGNQDEQYFSDGLSEDLITALSQFAGLKVINRDSSFQFRHSKDSIQTIGEKLGVAHLLEGSVRRAGGEVRISA